VKIGDRVRYRNEIGSHIYLIAKEDGENFGINHQIRSAMTGRVMNIMQWYRPDELEVIE
jgi:hypothetical protein